MTAATSSGSAHGTLAPFLRSCLIDHQSAAHQRTPVAGLHSLARQSLIVYLDKTKSSWFAAEAVTKNVHAIYRNTRIRKKRLHIGLCCLIGQIPDEKLTHRNISPN
jgi:hypothetical protein